MGTAWKDWADLDEVDTFGEFVHAFRAGLIAPAEFKRFRLQQGVYGQRQPDVHMVRVRISSGRLAAPQLDHLAEIAQLTPRGVGHVTTRQNIQFYDLPLDRVPDVLRSLADIGLTSREAGGNTVRNVTVGHCAGICAKEIFDPTPYAELVSRFFLRNPMNQSLPRKFKIAFSGCPDDAGLTLIHDLGARCAVRAGERGPERGFQLLLAGGLGSAPRLAEPLEAFTPAVDLLPTVAAVIRIFDRHGDRENRNMARLKFLARILGVEELRSRILRERDALRLTMASIFPCVVDDEDLGPARRPVAASRRPPGDPEFRRWAATNVLPQKQPGYVAIHARLPLGDVSAVQLRTLAQVASGLGDGTVRTTNQQNVLVPWIGEDVLAELYAILAKNGLARPGGERLCDITSCPGADSCQVGITSSRGLASALGSKLERELPELADDESIRIKISGCPNSCGQHYLAGIGLFGRGKKFHGAQAPAYQLLVGGELDGATPRLARPVARIPAKRVPEAVLALLRLYARDRQPGDAFNVFIERLGTPALKEVLAPWTELAAPAVAPGDYVDWGTEQPFRPVAGEAECAA